jgi:hypothetical protein
VRVPVGKRITVANGIPLQLGPAQAAIDGVLIAVSLAPHVSAQVRLPETPRSVQKRQAPPEILPYGGCLGTTAINGVTGLFRRVWRFLQPA